MSNIFAQLLQEGDRQQKQLKQERSLPVPQSVYSADPQLDSLTAGQQAVTTERQPDSTTAGQHTSIQRYIQAFLVAKATQKTTLRYPVALMTEIDDAIYQIRKTYGVTLSKNEIFLLGLASVLFDFKRNADHSLLNEYLIHAAKSSP